MIVTATFYGLTCDRCKTDFDDGEHTHWNDETTVLEQASESEWQEINGKHYCPNCYEDLEDEYVALEPFPENVYDLLTFVQRSLKGYTASISETTEIFKLKSFFSYKSSLDEYEENYIKGLIGDKLIHLDFCKDQKAKYTTRYLLEVIIEK